MGNEDSSEQKNDGLLIIKPRKKIPKNGRNQRK